MLTRTLDEILKDFGAGMGLDLSFDEKGVCRLELAELAAVDIKANEDDGTLTISSVLREELPDPITYSTILDLLALALDPAHRGGNSPVVGRDDESGLVVMYEVATPSALNRRPLADIFSEFLKTYSAVSALLDNQEAVAEKAKSDTAFAEK